MVISDKRITLEKKFIPFEMIVGAYTRIFSVGSQDIFLKAQNM